MGARAVFAATFAIGVLSAVPAFPADPGTPGPEPAAGVQPAAPASRENSRTAPPEPPAGTIIGEVVIHDENIFDIADPRENNWLFRLANRLHIRTRPWVIGRQLLFRPGDPYNPRLLAESERILRSNGYLYDAKIRPGEVRDGRVDVHVYTRDVWTLQPGVSFQRTGGENTTGVDLKEKNFLGLGSSLSIASKSTPDRRTISTQFSDDHLFGTRLRTDLLFASNSDGHQETVLLERPFYALDARWTASGRVDHVERVETLVGAVPVAGEFEAKRTAIDVFGGWSRGLVNGWVWRFFLGGKQDSSRFSPAPGAVTLAPIPADRVLVYPYAGFELIQDDYETAMNRDQIRRTEDFFLGWRARATAGYAFPSIGADRHATPFTASLGKGHQFGERWTVTGSVAAGGRVEHGAVRDASVSADGRIYLRWSEPWLSFATFTGSRLARPDDDRQLTLGGDTGLRGYPSGYQAGDRSFLVTVEQRYFTNWYPFRLFRVGGAVFFDMGRAWGGNVAGLPATGWLRDAGFGLRIGNVRSGIANVIHVDVAFPFDGDPSITRVQFLVTTKSSF